MFYCESCRVKNEWPFTLSRSAGQCEVCGDPALCHDRPAKYLPARTTGNWISTTEYLHESLHVEADPPATAASFRCLTCGQHIAPDSLDRHAIGDHASTRIRVLEIHRASWRTDRGEPTRGEALGADRMCIACGRPSRGSYCQICKRDYCPSCLIDHSHGMDK